MSECARCSERLSIEDTCLRAHPGEWTHKTCCAPEHEESDLETAQAELADREDLMEIAQQEMDRLRGMNKRLRAELAETRAAGDALAHQATELTIYLQGVPNVGSSRSRLSAWIDQWRSVRGDTPTDGFETTDTVSVPPKPTQNAAQIWIDGDGWSVAHGVSPPWIRARQTVCGRGVPSGRDPNPHGRRCRRCASLTDEPGGEGR